MINCFRVFWIQRPIAVHSNGTTEMVHTIQINPWPRAVATALPTVEREHPIIRDRRTRSARSSESVLLSYVVASVAAVAVAVAAAPSGRPPVAWRRAD